MDLGKKYGSNAKRANEGLGLGLGLGFGVVRYSRSMSGKRIAISCNIEDNSAVNTPVFKKQCSEKMALNPEKSLLEALPQDILIRVLCGVDHDDLKQLFHVSKWIREVTLIAKQLHFEHSTPRKAAAFQNNIIDLDEDGNFNDPEAPNAPRQLRSHRPRLSRKKLADISVALFASSPGKERWPMKQLLKETETDDA